jgi:hypothetical protein
MAIQQHGIPKKPSLALLQYLVKIRPREAKMRQDVASAKQMPRKRSL